MRQVGRRISKARKAAGLTQLELAQKMNKLRHEISRYENGHYGLRIPELVRLAAILNVPVGYFFEFDDSNLDPSSGDT